MQNQCSSPLVCQSQVSISRSTRLTPASSHMHAQLCADTHMYTHIGSLTRASISISLGPHCSAPVLTRTQLCGEILRRTKFLLDGMAKLTLKVREDSGFIWNLGTPHAEACGLSRPQSKKKKGECLFLNFNRHPSTRIGHIPKTTQNMSGGCGDEENENARSQTVAADREATRETRGHSTIKLLISPTQHRL